jgi:polysaccharide chain length determinant protein (PEP-CTERM system associated)
MVGLVRETQLLLHAVWSRRWVAVLATWVVAVVGAVVVWFVPERYEANSRIYVDTQTVLKPLMAGLAFQPDIDQQVRMLARTLVSRPNLELLLDKLGPTIGVTAENRDRAIDGLMERIRIEPTGGNLYLISFRDTEARRAQTIVGGLVDLFVGRGVDSKEKDSAEASSFIDSQIHAYEAKLSEAENRLKEFKVRNFSVSGVSNQDYFARTSAISDEVSRLRVALAAAEQSRDALKRELAREDPRLPAEALRQVGAQLPPSEIDQRIEAQSRQLDDLLRRYTDAHPDVVSARRIIKDLEAEKATLASRDAGSEKTNGSAATSPVFQRIRVALAEAEANVASTRSQLAAQQQRLTELRAAASRLPQAEAELAQLNRDYDVIRKNYEQLVARREAASLGLKMDRSAQIADFRVIEPPRVSPKPVFPNRTALAIAAVLIALGAGFAAAYAIDHLAPRFVEAKALQELSKRPVLGTISVYPTAATLALRQRSRLQFSSVVLAFVLVQGAWIAWVSSSSGHSTEIVGR